MKPTTQRKASQRTPPTWSLAKRRLVSVLLVLHLLGIFVAPWSSPPPASRLSMKFGEIFRPYLAAAFLNHGYRFFAPDPGPSHLVRYELERDDGIKVSGRIPDPRTHRPRLMYHRHFMMTETLFNIWSQLKTVPDDVQIPVAEREFIERQNQATQEMVDRLAAGMANELLRNEQGRSVRLYLVEHAIPYPEDVVRGRRLDEPDSYTDLADLGVFPRTAP